MDGEHDFEALDFKLFDAPEGFLELQHMSPQELDVLYSEESSPDTIFGTIEGSSSPERYTEPKIEEGLPGTKRRRTTIEAPPLKIETPVFHYYPYQHPALERFRIFDSNRREITTEIDLDVRADKNVAYFPEDDDFIHYKQNHFQITTEFFHTQKNERLFLYIQNSLQPIEAFYTDVYAIKTKKVLSFEMEQRVPLYQAGKSRTKGDNHPAEPTALKDGIAVHSRLRFGASTPHNNKGKEPGPQEYFRLVVALRACVQGSLFLLLSKISDPLIVRGSNPGRYVNTKNKNVAAANTPRNDGWQKKDDVTTITGKVGINTETPTEALSVNGNILVTGNVLKPSDQRVKENVTPVNSTQQLENIKNLKIYDYSLKKWKDSDGKDGENPENPEIASSERRERGVLAQELQQILPQAVQQLNYDVNLNNGTTVTNLLVVNERVLLFENIGATQELSKILEQENQHIGTIDNRIERLEEGGIEKIDEQSNRLDEVIEFVTDDEYQLDKEESWCCYCSVFGMGPAWTLFILGFFFWMLWMVGIVYIFSCNNKVRKIGGLANLTASVLAIVYLALVPLSFPKTVVVITFLASFLAGITILVILTCYTRNRSMHRKMARQKLRSYLRQKVAKDIRLRPKIYSFSSRKAGEEYHELVEDGEEMQEL